MWYDMTIKNGGGARMKGSEKQISWATSLIKTMDYRFNQILDELKQSQSNEYDQVNLILGTIKSMFEDAYAGDIITLLKDNRKETAREYYDSLCRDIFSCTLPFAKNVKEIMTKQEFTVKLQENPDANNKSDNVIEITDIKNERYAADFNIHLTIGEKYAFQGKGEFISRNGTYTLYLNGEQIQSLSVPIGSGLDSHGIKYAIFIIGKLEKAFAFRCI